MKLSMCAHKTLSLISRELKSSVTSDMIGKVVIYNTYYFQVTGDG